MWAMQDQWPYAVNVGVPPPSHGFWLVNSLVDVDENYPALPDLPLPLPVSWTRSSINVVDPQGLDRIATLLSPTVRLDSSLPNTA